MEKKRKTSKHRKFINRLAVKNVVLVGGTGSGKTTIGRHLARLLDFGVYDLDLVIEKIAGRPISEIFHQKGENSFREMESDIIREAESIRNHVLISGAGAIEKEENWGHLKELGPVIWIATPISEVVRRLENQPDEIRKRPLLSEAANIEDRQERHRFLHDRLEDLQKRRLNRFQEADYIVDGSFATSETCAQFIKSILLNHGDDSYSSDLDS